MKIYETAVRKPVSTALLFVGAIVLGVFSLNNLSIDLYPEVEIPYLTVLTTYPGASAEDIEQNVTRVLENSLNTVSNLKKLTSRSQENMSVVMLQFEWGANLDEASNDVRDVLGRMETYLPDNVDKPFIVKFSSSMMPIMYLSATANESYNALYKMLDEKVANPLNRISGVGAVSISGAPVREVQVNVDPLKMEAYRLTIEQIGQIIAQENSNIPAGFLDIGSEKMSLRIQGEFTESDALRNIVVATIAGREIRIGDIAVVKDTIRKKSVAQTINGQKGVSMIIQKQSGANSVATIKEIHKMLPELTKTLPPDVKIGVMFDTAEYITNSINSLTETLMYAFIFVVLVVLFFLGRWRATVIIVVTIPVSLITSFIYLFFTGGTINIVSLSSFSIGIGLVVDDAIVILENIVKHIERGARPKDAAVYATNEVWLAVIATTFTLLAVFLPLTLVGGIAGIMFKQLGWIVSIVTTVSTIAAISLTPMMASKMLKYKYIHTYRGLGIIFKPIDRFLNNLDSAYARLVTWAVRHKSVTIITATAIFVVSLLLLSRVPTDFMPTTDNGQIAANLEMPVNANLEETVAVANYLEGKFLALCPEIERISITSGADDRAGFSALFGNSGSNVISYMVVLTKLKDRSRSMDDIADIMRQEIEKIPSVVKFTVSPGGSRGGEIGRAHV
jgi:HAE1 family hydrophobic/amphiphilic exporter-1